MPRFPITPLINVPLTILLEEPGLPSFALLFARFVSRPLLGLKRELVRFGQVDLTLLERPLGRVEARVARREKVRKGRVELVEADRKVRPLERKT